MNTPQPSAMKVIDMSSNRSVTKEYLTRPVEQTHTKEELEAVHRAIRFTKMFKQEESLSKMDEEEAIARPVPTLPRLHD